MLHYANINRHLEVVNLLNSAEAEGLSSAAATAVVVKKTSQKKRSIQNSKKNNETERTK